MRISTTACYALQLLICLLEHQDDLNPLSAAELAAHTHIPEKFARKILHSLHVAKIVRSRRGIAGGYALSVPPSEISLTCIIRAVEGGIAAPTAQEPGSRSQMACGVWALAAQALENVLKEYTLKHIMDIMSSPCPQNAHGSHNHKPGEEAAENTQGSGGRHAKTPSLGRRRSRKLGSAQADIASA